MIVVPLLSPGALGPASHSPCLSGVCSLGSARPQSPASEPPAASSQRAPSDAAGAEESPSGRPAERHSVLLVVLGSEPNTPKLLLVFKLPTNGTSRKPESESLSDAYPEAF